MYVCVCEAGIWRKERHARVPYRKPRTPSNPTPSCEEDKWDAVDAMLVHACDVEKWRRAKRSSMREKQTTGQQTIRGARELSLGLVFHNNTQTQ